MAGPYVKLSQITPPLEVTVNMNRVLYYHEHGNGGTVLVMNIPKSFLHVSETPHEIRHLTRTEEEGF
jgi:hypothetical protein